MAKPEHHESMQATHGQGPSGRTCGECSSCVDRRRPHPGRGTVTYYICRKATTRMTAHGVVRYQNWLKSWPACGLFQAGEV